MQQLESNQILLEISKDKKKVTVSCGAFYHPLTFDACPSSVTENLGNSIKAYIEQTGLDAVPEWKDEKCDGLCDGCN